MKIRQVMGIDVFSFTNIPNGAISLYSCNLMKQKTEAYLATKPAPKTETSAHLAKIINPLKDY